MSPRDYLEQALRASRRREDILAGREPPVDQAPLTGDHDGIGDPPLTDEQREALRRDREH